MLASLLGFLLILNPFALCLYLRGVMEDLERPEFIHVVLRASLISFAAFVLSAWAGKPFLQNVMGVRPAAMQAFGGLIFLNVAYIYVSKGYKALELLRGSLDELPSEIAMPFMIGGGTITKSIIIGETHGTAEAAGVLLVGMVVCAAVVVVFKTIFDRVQGAHERVFTRYVNLLTRANGLLIGAISVDMIVTGARDLVRAG